MKNYKIGKYTLTQKQNSVALVRELVPTKVPTNHIFILDCSGSMYGTIDQIREDLKKKFVTLLGDDDTVSIIWFSSTGQCGSIFEFEKVNTLSELKKVEAALDRWLRTMGATGFIDPLKLCEKLVTRSQKEFPNNSISVLFLSDGYDNCCNRADIVKQTEKVGKLVHSLAVVEYGHYADRNLLANMAESAGGSLVFSENFRNYEPIMQNYFNRKVMAEKKMVVDVGEMPLGGFAFALKDGEILAYGVDDGKISVPESVENVWFLTEKQGTNYVSVERDSVAESAIYAAMSLYSMRMNSDVVFSLLKTSEDVSLINQFSSCFGKQKYADFQGRAKLLAFDPSLRYSEGKDANAMPDDDAYTIIGLLGDLIESNANLLLDHKDFEYSRIGIAKVSADTNLTSEEQTEYDSLIAGLQHEKNAEKIKASTERISELLAKKKEPLSFVAEDVEDGYSISSLTFNEDRPNISVLVKKYGTIDLSSRLPKEFTGSKVGSVPKKFPSFVYRNYTIVKDGIINLKKLPVKIENDSLEILKKVPHTVEGNGKYVLDISKLPVVNRSMVKSVSVQELAEKEYELAKLKSEQKVYKYFLDQSGFEKKSEAYAALYGEAAATWLKEQGITEYNGFSPKVVSVESTDVYMAKELRTLIKGFSTLPKVSDAETKLTEGKKVTPLISLMKNSIEASKNIMKLHENNLAAAQTALHTEFLNTQKRVRKNMIEMAKIKFSVIVGQVWFKEFKSIDENSWDFVTPEGSLNIKVDMKEVETKI